MSDWDDLVFPGDPVGYGGTGGWRRLSGDAPRPSHLDDADFAEQRRLARELEGFVATPADRPEQTPAPAGRPETPRDEPGASQRPPRRLRALPDPDPAEARHYSYQPGPGGTEVYADQHGEPMPAPALPHPRDLVRAWARGIRASLAEHRDEPGGGGDRP